MIQFTHMLWFMGWISVLTGSIGFVCVISGLEAEEPTGLAGGLAAVAQAVLTIVGLVLLGMNVK